jgi:zinc transport system substrate-binding protein
MVYPARRELPLWVCHGKRHRAGQPAKKRKLVMKRVFAAVIACLIVNSGLTHSAVAKQPEALNVVVTIKPIHSLAAGVMEGVGKPKLLLQGASSPHAYAIKPSDAKALSTADAIIRVSENLETFLNKTLKTLPKNARVIDLDHAPGLKLLPVRDNENFEAHGEEAGHSHSHGHVHGAKKGEGGGEDEGADVHFWLNPLNAAKLAVYIADELAKAAPQHAATFKANAEKMSARLTELDQELEGTLAPAKDRPFIVFHDVLQYMEERYGLKAAGSITVSPERQPGAKRLKAVRVKIEQLGAACVFAEPQFPPKMVDSLIEGTRVKKGTLDEIGVESAEGPGHYFDFMRKNAENLVSCLRPSA